MVPADGRERGGVSSRALPWLADVAALLLCWAAGELLARVLPVPVPGPVLGLLLLLAVLSLRGRGRTDEAPTPASDALLRVLPLLFVPAGVGVVEQLALLQREWVAAAVGLVLPLLVSLVVTGVVTGVLLRRTGRGTS